MTSWITICDTCKRDDFALRGPDQTDGAQLADLVEPLARQAGIPTRRVSCLMGCTHGCNIAIQAAGKLNYTLGRFEPVQADAAAIVEYAEKHAAAPTGQVPFREWPQGVKGHFITRHPPLPEPDPGVEIRAGAQHSAQGDGSPRGAAADTPGHDD